MLSNFLCEDYETKLKP